MWGYYWGYTIAQIELMAMDAPIVVYHKDKKNGKKEFKKADPVAVLRTQMKWEENNKNRKEGEKIVLNFGGNNQSEKQ